MRTVRLTLDKGLALGSPPADLEPGEMLLARNCHYEPESLSILKVKGRTLFGNIAAATATGLSFVSFRSAGRFLLATAGTTLASAPVGTTGTFTSRRTLGTTSGRMEAVYYNGTDRAYIVDGVNNAQVWDGTSASARDLGLLSPTTAPTITILTNSATAYTNTTTFAYCYTEYDSVNDIESGPSPVAQNQATAASATFKIVVAAKVNSSANRYRLYRTQDGGDVFFRLAEFPDTVTQYYDGDNTEGPASNREDNDDEWGFKTVNDIFLSTRPVLPMLGAPITGNYITTNARPPVGNIAIVFENSLCISGVPAFPQDIYYSQPDSPEQFSPIYYLREENERGDPVTGLGIANDRLIAFTLNSIFRHDTLPRVTDPGFGLGVATRQEVTKDHGCVAKRSITNFGVGVPNNRLFYLSSRGPFMTDGYTTVPLGGDLDWSDRLINFSRIDRAVAVNYPKYFQIRLFLASTDSTTNDMCFIYHYHQNHMKRSGIGKWTGPVPVRADSATVAYEGNTETRLYLADANTSGNVYLEDNGLVDGQAYEHADGRINWEWKTGDLDLRTPFRNKKIHRVFLNYVGTDSFDATLKYSMNQNDDEHTVALASITANQAGTERFGTSTVDAIKNRRIRGGVWQTGTHIRLHMEESAANKNRELSGIEIELEDYGKQV